MLVRSPVLVTLLATLLALPPTLALAGGFEVGDNGSVAVSRGGAFTVRADDLTALAHNPAGLLKLRGTHVQWSHNVVNQAVTFQRQPSQIPMPAANPPGTDPLAPVSNQTPWFPLGAMVVGATDFGLENWTFAAGVYGPSAAGHQEWPVSGGQRYMLTKLDTLLMFYSLAAAYGDRDKWGFGATLQLAHQPKTELSLVVDAVPNGPMSPYYNRGADVVSTIAMSAPPAPTALLGAWYRLSDNWELAASGRVLPAYLHNTGTFTLANTDTGPNFSADKLAVKGNSASMDLVLPPTARLGVRYRDLSDKQENWDVELNAVYEAWHMLDEYQVKLKGTILLFPGEKQAPTVTIPKRWSDTVSLRLGGSYHLPGTGISLSLGSYVENGAVPNDYTHLDFPSFNRLGVSGGVQAKVGRVDLSFGYMHVFQETRTVTEANGQVYQTRPLAPCPANCGGYDAVPANAGTYTSHFDTLSASAMVGF